MHRSRSDSGSQRHRATEPYTRTEKGGVWSEFASAAIIGGWVTVTMTVTDVYVRVEVDVDVG